MSTDWCYAVICQRVGSDFPDEKGKRKATLHRNDIKVLNFTKKRKDAIFFGENSGKPHLTVII